MKKIILSLFIIAIAASSCGNKPTETNNRYVITGELSDTSYNNAVVYLQTMGESWNKRRSTVNIDTTVVANGSFSFEGNADSIPVLRFVTIEKQASGERQKIMFVLEPDSIKIAQGQNGFLVNGTGSNTLIPQYRDLIDKTNTLPDSECAPMVAKFIKENIQNPIGEYTLVDKGYYLDDVQLNEVLGLARSEFKNSIFGQVLVKRNDALSATAIGKQFTDLKGTTPEGQPIALSEYAGKGKFVLVDFWASWCPPCREDMPLLVKAYAKYKNKGFEIVGVSLDDENDKWTNGIKLLKITWPQMSDLKGWESDLSQAYGVSIIPHTVLLDKEGKIIAKNIEGKDLDAKLTELFK